MAAENPAAGKDRGRNMMASRKEKAANVPCQPRVGGEAGHRHKHKTAWNLHDLGIPAMVARPAS